KAFQSLAAFFAPPAAREGEGSAEGFGLANYDLNLNNFLVDWDFNVLAVIDWDSVVSVPDAALYRLPFAMGISCAVPGVVDTHPAVMRREQLRSRFAEVVEAVAHENGPKLRKNGPRTFSRSRDFSLKKRSRSARWSGKNEAGCQDWVTKSGWLQGLKRLSKHDEPQVAEFYL
ncbi:hypothetical protein B0T26DRAFT_602963, partial [Lasiosphaeria miniovina]